MGDVKVRVAGRRECEVALIFRAVASLLEGSQHQVAQDALPRVCPRFWRPASDSFRDVSARIIQRDHILPHTARRDCARCGNALPAFHHPHSASSELRGQRPSNSITALGVGTVVNAKKSWGPALPDATRTASLAASMNSSIKRCAMLRRRAP